MQHVPPDSGPIQVIYKKYSQDNGSKNSLLENPPKVRKNISEFGVYSLARNSVTHCWTQSFISELEHLVSTVTSVMAYPSTSKAENFPKSIVICLKSVFSLVRQSRRSHPDVCISALKILLETLDNFKPEDLLGDPAEVIEEMFTILLELSTVDEASEEGKQITALSCSCLLALVVASGSTSKIITAISHLLITTESLGSHYVVVPKIMSTFYKTAKHIVLGSKKTLCYMEEGIQNDNVITELRLTLCEAHNTFHRPFKVYSFVSDSSYLYLSTSFGLFKIGTGFSGTIKTHLYGRNPATYSCSSFFYHKQNIFLMDRNTKAVFILNKDNLDVCVFKLQLPKEFSIPKAIQYTDVEHIGLIYPNKDDRLVLNLYEMILQDKETGRLILVKKIYLNLAKQYTYILGWPTQGDDITQSLLEPMKINHDHTIASVMAGQNFTLCRTALGQIYYNGNPSTLGLKSNSSIASNTWNQLFIGNNANVISGMAVGHEGHHAIFITDEGVALYYGTPQRGEDGDTHKHRRLVPVKNKPFKKLESEIVIQAACNYLSTALVTKSGKLFIYGKDSQYTNSEGLVKVLQPYRIVQVSLGKAHVVALTSDGDVITFGINNKGQCGRFYQKCCIRHKWEFDLCMLCTNCGSCTGFTNCTNSSPEVHGTRRICGCGEGNSGCADCGICVNCAQRTLVESCSPKSSTDIPSTSGTSLNLKSSKKKSTSLFIKQDEFSSSSDTELTSRKANLPPDSIDLDYRIKSVSCGLHHTVVLSDRGEVFTFGLNSSGQLGNGNSKPCTRIVRVNVPKAIQVAAGSYHTVILLENGDVLTMGANNKGQLGRVVNNNEATPSPMAHFGTVKGCKATWIGASGDQTFIKLDESIVNLHLLKNSVICGNKQNLLLVPIIDESLSKQLLVNKKDGECFSFDKKHMANFQKNLTVFDPGFDGVWDYIPLEAKFVCYNHYKPSSTGNSAFFNVGLPKWDFGNRDMYNEDGMARTCQNNLVNVLTSELALTNVPDALVTRQHLAINMLACVDTINRYENLKSSDSDHAADYNSDKKATDYNSVTRFTFSTNTGWKNQTNSVAAIKFCPDQHLLIGGCTLYGNQGEYTVKMSIYDVGFDGDKDECGEELLAETDIMVCKVHVNNRFSVYFGTPVMVQAHCWYVLTTEIGGPHSKFGTGGIEEIMMCDVTFKFKSSSKSTNGTTASTGQIPCLLFKKHQRFENVAYDIDVESIHTLKCLYGKEIGPTALNALHTILERAWKHFTIANKRFQSNTEDDNAVISNDMEKYAIICMYVVRLLNGYMTEMYPLIPPDDFVEYPELLDVIPLIRQQFISIFTFNQKTALLEHESVKTNVIEYAYTTLFAILYVVQGVYENIFHILYPLSESKWKHLCQALRNVKESKNNDYVFLLNSICTALAKSPILRKELEHLAIEPIESDEIDTYAMLVHKLTYEGDDGEEPTPACSFQEVIDDLLYLINDPTVKHVEFLVNKIALKSCTSESYCNNLVKNCCLLLIRIVSELTQLCTGEDAMTGIESRQCLKTPSRFCVTNPPRSWVTKKGFPDAVAFEVDTPDICLLGVTLFGGIGEYSYNLEILTQTCDSNIPIWTSLEHKKGTFTVFGNEPVEIFFSRAVSLKEKNKYALQLWNFGPPSKSGSQGIPVVIGPDGTTFTFSKCNLSVNGTNVSMGQIPSLIYINKTCASRLGDSVRKEVATLCRQIVTESCSILPRITRPILEQNPLRCHEIFEGSPTFALLIPFVLAQLNQLTEPEICVETLAMIKEILPSIVNLITIYIEDMKSYNSTGASHAVAVESDHPYKSSNVFVERVKFAPNIGFMLVEMDPRSGTSQPEDSLTLYIPQNGGNKTNTAHSSSTLLLKNGNSDELTAYIPFGQKYKTDSWPKQGLLVPGNEILFYMETAADYIKDDKANKFGFKCEVFAYENVREKYSVLPRLELDLAHLGSICAATLINQEMSPFGIKAIQSSSVYANSTSEQIKVVLNSGLALKHLPSIKEALNGTLVFKHDDSKHKFLEDFIKRVDDTPGGRLARWLQPDSFVDPNNCFMVGASSKFYSSEKCEVVLALRDQHDKPVSFPEMYVEFTAHRHGTRGRQQSSSCAQSFQEATPPFEVPYTATIIDNAQFHCITMIKAYQDYSLEELRMSSPIINRITEHLVISSIVNDKVYAFWIPQSPGVYVIDCTIDGYPAVQNLHIYVHEPLEKKDPPVSIPLDLHKPDVNNIRTVIGDDSAGLRVRSYPTLQSQQIGLLPCGTQVSFDDVVMNGDGVWLKLSIANVSRFVNTLSQNGEAWCMQFNQHLGKCFLYPNVIENNDEWFVIDQAPEFHFSEDEEQTYQVVKTCDVRSKPSKSSKIVGALIAGDTIKSKNGSTLVDAWVELSSSVVEKYGFVSHTGESWVLASCLQINSEGEGNSGPHSHNGKQEKVAKKSDGSSLTKKESAEKVKRRSKDSTSDADRSSHTGKSVSFGGAMRKVKKTENPEEVDKPKSTKEETKRSPPKKADSKSRGSSKIYEGYEHLPHTKKKPDQVDNEPVDTSNTDTSIPAIKPQKAISPYRAESLRALFAGFVWYEGIVDDALTCASYLKFYPNLPKEGAEVVTRSSPQVPQNQSQRHSVEVTNAGNYLNIQQSTLESLNKSGINASRNRKRKFKECLHQDVTIISEEESVQFSDDQPSTIRNFLPAALRALVALWDEFGELQIQDSDLERSLQPRRMTSPPKKCDKDSSQHSTDSDDNFCTQDIAHVFEDCEKQACELCSEAVALPMTNHFIQVHEGCGRFSCKGYNYTGLYTKGWFGKCGSTETTTLGLGYILCDTCRSKFIERKIRSSSTVDGDVIDPPPDLDDENMIFNRNSMFLLTIQPNPDTDDNPTGGVLKSDLDDTWRTAKGFNSLQQLLSGELHPQSIDVQPVNERPTTSVHRSASMSNEGFEESITSASSLLCRPSKALLKLMDVPQTNREISSTEKISVNREFFYLKPSIDLLCQGDRDIQKYNAKMVNAVKTATIRKYGLEALNWLLHTVSRPISLHELMWAFNGAMIDNAPPREVTDFTTQWWSNNLAGSELNSEERSAFHKFLKSLSDLIPHLPMTSPLLLQAMRCWRVVFTKEDHHFLHNSKIFSNISKVLAFSDQSMKEALARMTLLGMELANEEENPTISSMNELTRNCSFAVSSRPDMVEFLTDGSTETFWESSEDNRTKPRTIDITLGPGIVPSTLWIHLDNVRDAATRAFVVAITYSGTDNVLKEVVQDVSVNFCGWLNFNLHDVSSVNRVIHCEIRGICNLVRVRQVKLFGDLVVLAEDIPCISVVTRNIISNETIKTFHDITYQVFGPVIMDTTINSNIEGLNRPLSMVDDAYCNGHNNLREHVVGVLFSQETLTVLQKQLMTHIINAISLEARCSREAWESNLKRVNENIVLSDQEFEVNKHQDEFCYEMISMVLTLSGCDLGRSSLSKHSFLIKDLLTLLHTGSARVQRQVIAILRRMIGEVNPLKMMIALNGNNLNGNLAPKETVIDHLIACISKSLRVQVKSRDGGSASVSQPVTMAGAIGKLLPSPSTPWYYQGCMTKKHAQLIIQLLNDMAKGKMSSSWAEATTISITELILSLTNLTDEERSPSRCIASPILWRAMGSLCVVTEEQANRLNNKNCQNNSKEVAGSSKESTSRPMCVNHDDGETLALIECSQCGPMCQDCDRFLHLRKTNKTHQRQVCKEEISAIQVELHEGCGRVKLFWLFAFVDQRSLKSIIEFRFPDMDKFTVISSKSTGQCRFCGAHGDSGLLSIGNVCAEKECQEHSKNACVRILHCGHHCGGYKGEKECLPCLHGCAYVSGDTPQQEEAASKPIERPMLRQDAEDMCMICFTDRLIAAPAVLLLCGHVFHYHCTKKILENRWVGPRISFTFSLCPICKVEIDHPAFQELLEPIRHLQKDVKSKALIRLEYESLTNAAIIATRYNNSAIDYAMDRYSYYVCFVCKKAYFGGEAHCDAESSNTNNSYNPAELVCGGCSDVTQSKMCKLHGSDYLEYKCRYCCTIAIFFCLGDTHFCGHCHDQFQVIRRLSLEELPQCPAGPKGVQLEGTSDDCPLRVKHPPTGYEFALGCGICRNNTNF